MRDKILIEEIRRIHADNYHVYGVIKMWKAMQKAGYRPGPDCAAAASGRCAGVVRGRRPRTTTPSSVPDLRPDLVERDFTAPEPNKLCVADITYVRITSGFAYTAFVTDVFSRNIVGWATRSSITTEALSLEALEHATNTALHQFDDLVHHSG